MANKIITLGLTEQQMGMVRAGVDAEVVNGGANQLNAQQIGDIIGQAPDLLVINNHMPPYAGLDLAQQFRDLGFRGLIHLVVTQELPREEPQRPGYDDVRLRASVSRGIINEFVSSHQLETGDAARVMRNVLNRINAAKARRGDAVGHVAVVGGMGSGDITKALREHAHVHYTITSESRQFYTPDRQALMLYDVVVIDNHHIGGATPLERCTRGIHLAEEMRALGYQGKIVMVSGGQGATEEQQLALAKARKVFDQVVPMSFTHSDPVIFAGVVDRAMREQKKLKTDGLEGDIRASVGIAGQAAAQEDIAAMLAGQKDKGQVFATQAVQLGRLTAQTAQDVLVVQMQGDVGQQQRDAWALQALRKSGYAGRIVVIEAEKKKPMDYHAAGAAIGITGTPTYMTLLGGGAIATAPTPLLFAHTNEAARHEGNAPVTGSPLLQEGLADAVLAVADLKYNSEKVVECIARQAAARGLEKQRMKGLAEWDVEKKTRRLVAGEQDWPEAMRLNESDVRQVHARVTDVAGAKQVVSGARVPEFHYGAFARELDVAWAEAVRQVLERKVNDKTGKSRLDAAGRARDATEDERKTAAEQKRKLREEDGAELRVLEQEYIRQFSAKASDWNVDESEQKLPYAIRAGKGGLLDYATAMDEAMKHVRESGVVFGDFETYRDAAHAAFATRVVDMLASVNRLEGDAKDPEVAKKVVYALTRGSNLPARHVANEKEAALFAKEEQDVKGNRGMMRVPEMPKRWVLEAERELGLQSKRKGGV